MSDLYGTIVNAKVMNTSTIDSYILSSNLEICYQIVVQRYIYILYKIFWDFPQYTQYSGPYKLYHEDTTEFIQDDV